MKRLRVMAPEVAIFRSSAEADGWIQIDNPHTAREEEYAADYGQIMISNTYQTNR
jgi:hypothetical protein